MYEKNENRKQNSLKIKIKNQIKSGFRFNPQNMKNIEKNHIFNEIDRYIPS